MKKTKKQKFLADIRRKMVEVEREKQELSLQSSPSPSPRTVYNFAQPVKEEKFTIEFSQIARDLKKTMFVSIIIIISLVVIKFYLK